MSTPPREIRLNAFAMHTITHQSPGLWRHPRDRSREFKRLPLWLDLARLLERGLFDGIFLADVLGPYDVFGGDARAAIRSGAQLPAHDPMLLVPAMATVTPSCELPKRWRVSDGRSRTAPRSIARISRWTSRSPKNSAPGR